LQYITSNSGTLQFKGEEEICYTQYKLVANSMPEWGLSQKISQLATDLGCSMTTKKQGQQISEIT